jgi:hypothetical protein
MENEPQVGGVYSIQHRRLSLDAFNAVGPSTRGRHHLEKHMQNQSGLFKLSLLSLIVIVHRHFGTCTVPLTPLSRLEEAIPYKVTKKENRRGHGNSMEVDAVTGWGQQPLAPFVVRASQWYTCQYSTFVVGAEEPESVAA